jgi:hypothetical protein
MYSNTTGSLNNALGRNALMSNTTGTFNTATGGAALFLNTTGNANTSTGREAMHFNTTGNNNTATGFFALYGNTTGSNNIALGNHAGDALTSGDSNIDIGNAGVSGESGTIRIGTEGTQKKTFIAGISTTGVMGSALKISSNGQLGVAPSSARFKQEIRSMDKTSEVLLALRPVTFRYKPEIDLEGVQQFGLVAEEVEKINPDLVARDAEGKVFTVRYEAVNAMLLNEFLKEHCKLQELEATVAEQQKDFQATAAHQQKQIEALTAGLQKVSAEVEMSRPAPQVVDNRQ